ncbi:MAG TPA: hypothetical protein VFG91_01260 [Woeseiaceae bacterium]|nr:hypothetical protein [Woeseiaceae bacterium]
MMAMQSDIEKVYPYVMRWWQIVVLIVLGAVLGVFATDTALHNDVGLIINGVVELGVGGATVFWWCLAGIMWLLPVLGLVGIIDKLKGGNRVAITAEGVFLPNPFWRKGEAYFSYKSVRDLTITTMKKARFLTIKTAGKNYTIVSNRFSRPEEFDEIIRTVADRSNI